MNQFISKYKTCVEWLSYILYAISLFSLAFPWSLTQPIIVAWVIMWALEFRWLKRPTWHGTNVVHVLFIALLIFEALSLLWHDNTPAIVHELNLHLPFVYVLVISLWGLNKHHDTDVLKCMLIMGSILSAAFYICFNQYVISHNVEEYMRPVTSTNIFELSEGPSKWLKHRQDYSIVLLLSIAFCPSLYNLLRRNNRVSKNTALILTIVTMALLIGIIVLTLSRIALVILPAVLIVMLYHIGAKYISKRTLAIAIGCVIAISVAVLVTHPRMQRLYNDFRNIEQGLPEDFERPHDPRWNIWKTVIDNRESYGLLGIGIGNEKEFLIEKYKEEQFWHEATQEYGTHNQYFQEWVTLGPIAMLLLITAFILMPFMPPKGHRYTAIIVTLIYMVSMLTDIPLSFIGTLYILYCALILIELEQPTNLLNRQ